jgi:molecular chaperone HscB
MNYFEFYEIPVSFSIDQQLLKNKFFSLSKKYHPDFFVNKESVQQKEMLDISTFNTKAFQTLSDFNKRMKYILELKNQIYEGERYELPSGFLMEMMEINESMMDVKMDGDAEKIIGIRRHVEDLFENLYEEVRTLIESYDDATAGQETLKKIKDYYYKKKYLLRIQHSLDTFEFSEKIS